ncbi:MAG: hypothetical protein GOVbin1434_33 [Prokaryotic dsDNA virus sp.]|nr:MAG: hypothetical protein GOVbin1434_33 [Prokaryotic dsDNA virus sp.]|tara:strand:+ start:5950 stop:6228 length:279 start_codon:yes stop_codon:yes gene_type:complete
MEIKLKSKKLLKVKNISIDERDSLLDSVEYQFNDDGTSRGVKMMHSTMTKWIRTCIVDSSDDFIKSLSLEDKTKIFTELQGMFFKGEEKASK